MTSQIVPSDSYIRFLTPPQPCPAPENVRNILSEYRLTYLLGSGGFADVYAGTDGNGRDIAIKIPQMKFDTTIDSSVYDKYEKETGIWKNLKHPNIVALYSAVDQPLPHIVMEMMDGGSLESLMKRHKLTVGEAVYIMLQVLEGLSYAHHMATVHRDLKPDNILFTSTGEAKITDWGIGKLLSLTEMTKTVGIKGTLNYCAPEQFDQKKYGKIDWQTDIFQIGIIFYEMLTGINPFAGEDMPSVYGKLMNIKPEPPSSLNDDVRPELDEIVMGALVKEKVDRWRTDVMRFQLNQIIKGRPVPRRKKTTPLPTKSSPKILAQKLLANLHKKTTILGNEGVDVSELNKNYANVERFIKMGWYEKAIQLTKKILNDLDLSYQRRSEDIDKSKKEQREKVEELFEKAFSLGLSVEHLYDCSRKAREAREEGYLLRESKLNENLITDLTSIIRNYQMNVESKEKEKENPISLFFEAVNLYKKKKYVDAVKVYKKSLKNGLGSEIGGVARRKLEELLKK